VNGQDTVKFILDTSGSGQKQLIRNMVAINMVGKSSETRLFQPVITINEISKITGFLRAVRATSDISWLAEEASPITVSCLEGNIHLVLHKTLGLNVRLIQPLATEAFPSDPYDAAFIFAWIKFCIRHRTIIYDSFNREFVMALVRNSAFLIGLVQQPWWDDVSDSYLCQNETLGIRMSKVAVTHLLDAESNSTDTPEELDELWKVSVAASVVLSTPSTRTAIYDDLKTMEETRAPSRFFSLRDRNDIHSTSIKMSNYGARRGWLTAVFQFSRPSIC
jgi:hypothetical protein